jgi:hypothetical protein
MAGGTGAAGASYGLLDPLIRLFSQKYSELLYNHFLIYLGSIKIFKKSDIFGGQKVLILGIFQKNSKSAKPPKIGLFAFFFKFWIFQKYFFSSAKKLFFPMFSPLKKISTKKNQFLLTPSKCSTKNWT